MKRALVIGNDDYPFEHQKLESCVDDANDMHDALRIIGFDVLRKTNIPFKDTQIATKTFLQSIQPGDTALFYFSGHGCQLDGINYLIPTNDTEIDEESVKHRTLNAQKLTTDVHVRNPGLFIMVLDCCRDNPFADQASLKNFFGFRSKRFKDGLAPMKGPPSTIIAYACAPDQLSLAGGGNQRNSAYTCTLLHYIVLPMDIKTVFQKTAIDVHKTTGRYQQPYLSINYNKPMYLVNNYMGPYVAPPKRRDATRNHQSRVDMSQHRWNAQFGMANNYRSRTNNSRIKNTALNICRSLLLGGVGEAESKRTKGERADFWNF
ncbi:unnamed protein product [Rotaria socialis]|uniref:Caspase family p20 domain-containing protein n=1 Tax=Rotaria socialis TaxID=392032 RepID=A0A819ZUS1_9BILA|nr:unnamed protein product [Rotaria socialis]CAF4373643.1 unnamed protein product [Rotaria socialis]CAF4776411.1 unnamed protein product [Rotaria socialis]